MNLSFQPPEEDDPRDDDQRALEVEATAKNLKHCAIVVSDWLAGGCDVNEIPRLHIAVLVTWTKESLPSLLHNLTDHRPAGPGAS